jgi:membrane-associated phospholipid phosphatase
MDSLTIFIARDLILLPVLAMLYIIWRLRGIRRRNFVIMLLASGMLAVIFAKTAAHIYYNPRPFLKDGITPLFRAAHDNGFPSDHTLLAAFLGFAALSYSMRWGIGLLVVALLIGWARVAAGVHHLVDVCGSFVFTGLAYLVVYHLQNRYMHARPKSHAKHS